MNKMVRTNPFPGLRAFSPEEEYLFFGRVESTSKVVARLIENRFVAVIGASGSGKSSLVLSGVIPSLRKEEAKSKKTWSYIVVRPELNPVDNLANELSGLSAKPGFTYMSPSAVAASLHNRSEGIIDIVNKIRKNLRQQVLIFIDQFEEIFRYSPVASRGASGDEATEFIDMLVNAAQQPDQGLYFILTLRSEYVSECSRFHSLTNLLNNGSYLLPQLSRDTLVSVIEEPVKLSGATIDRAVVRSIINDFGDKPGQLPVLQHMLMRMWNHWGKYDDLSRPISFADYEAVGKMKGAISQHAGQAYNSLDERQKYVCARLFRSITMRTDDGKEMRKPEKLSTIAALTACSVEELCNVADIFRAPEYSFITPAKEIPLNEGSIIDLSHESIIRLWGTLKKWLDEEDTSQKMYLHLAASAAQYQEGKGKLWTAPELLVALKWRSENNPTLVWAEKLDPAFERAMLFLSSSEEEYKAREEHEKATGNKKVRRSRRYAGILGLIVVICLLALGTFISLRVRSEKEKSLAVRQKDETLAINSLLTDSIDLMSDTIKAAGIKIEESKVLALNAIERARNAEIMVSDADELINMAEAGKNEAVRNAAEEKRKKMVSVGKSMAVRSLIYTSEKDLQILLAWQGYVFNNRYSGAANDPDIFSALYDVNKRYGNRNYYRFNTQGIEITAMTGESSGNLFYTADAGGRVLQWNAENPEKGYTIVWAGDKVIDALAVSPDAEWLACGTSSPEIIMIPLIANTMSYQLGGNFGNSAAMAFSADGDILYSSTTEGQLVRWDLDSKTGREICRTASSLDVLEVSPDNTMLAGITNDGRLMILQASDGEQMTEALSHDRVYTSLGFVPWDDRLVLADENGAIEIWKIRQAEKTTEFNGHDKGISSIAFNVKNKQMVTAGSDGKIKLWNISDLNESPVIIADNDEKVIFLGYTTEGKAFLAATPGSLIRRPSHVDYMTTDLCSMVTRNLTPEEWSAYVGRDIEYEKTCIDKTYKIRVNELRMSE